MKKIGMILLSVLAVLSVTACGGSGPKDSGGAGTDPLEILETVWGSYEEDEKFAVAGGDMSEENMTMDAPGKFSIEDAEALNSSLGFPADSVDKIDAAASLVHMMNANTFTCGAYHVADPGTISDTVEAVKENILQREWLCGFPDKLVIATVDDCILAFFGENEMVETFKTKLTEAYDPAKIVAEEPIG